VIDLVERLRLIQFSLPWSLYAQEAAALACEAAAEIERLRRVEAVETARADAPTIDWQRQIIVRAGVRIPLTGSEWLIFARLVKNSGKLVTRIELFDEIYGWDRSGGACPKIIDVFVCKLRKKSPWPITTVRGHGFIIDGCRYEKPPIPLPWMVAGLTRERLMAGR
jgi:DNA-binding response OmpR family regulator